jgi:transcriptional regulator with XRE-family HTH domain
MMQESVPKNWDVCVRLKAARKKTRLSQKDFGALGGVSVNTQLGYETGTMPPIDYLLRLGEAGVDWYWVITGNRIEGDSLSDDVLELVDAFRALPSNFQSLVVKQTRDLRECVNGAPESPE